MRVKELLQQLGAKFIAVELDKESNNQRFLCFFIGFQKVVVVSLSLACIP